MFDVAIPATALTVLLTGMAVLAVADVLYEKVEDWATGLLAIAVFAALLYDGVPAGQVIGGLVAAAVVFVLFLEIGVTGRMGGGDVKLSPVPALVLGTISPLLAFWWVGVAFAIQAVAQLAAQPSGQAKTAIAIPFVPAMAIAAGFSAYFGTALFGL